MISKIINNRGSLHNRITRPPIALAPFSLKECQEYLKMKKIDLNLEQIAELYRVTGGVAYYLDQVQRGQSAAQFINQNFFGEAEGLRSEFDRLFQSLFDHSTTHVELVRLLAKHPSGLSQADLIKKLDLKSGGSFTQTLTELEKSGFIAFTPQMNHKKKKDSTVL